MITTNSHLTTMNLRVQGYKRAFTDAGMEWNPDLYDYVDFVGFEKNIVETLDNIFVSNPMISYH